MFKSFTSNTASWNTGLNSLSGFVVFGATGNGANANDFAIYADGSVFAKSPHYTNVSASGSNISVTANSTYINRMLIMAWS